MKFCTFLFLLYVFNLFLSYDIGSSSVYYWPGYYSFPIKPKYHNKILTPLGANIETGIQAIDETIEHLESDPSIAWIPAIDETIEHLESDPSLNFMVVYVDSPDETGHEHGVGSKEVCYNENTLVHSPEKQIISSAFLFVLLLMFVEN